MHFFSGYVEYCFSAYSECIICSAYVECIVLSGCRVYCFSAYEECSFLCLCRVHYFRCLSKVFCFQCLIIVLCKVYCFQCLCRVYWFRCSCECFVFSFSADFLTIFKSIIFWKGEVGSFLLLKCMHIAYHTVEFVCTWTIENIHVMCNTLYWCWWIFNVLFKSTPEVISSMYSYNFIPLNICIQQHVI